MAPITFFCPNCGKQYRVDASRAGATGSCTQCGGEVTVPVPSVEPGAPAPAPQPAQPPPPPPPPDPAPAPAASDAPRSIGNCPYCREDMLTIDAITACPACETPHHQECWSENKGCTVFGCKMAPPDEEQVAVEAPTGGGGMPLQPAAAVAGAAGGTAALPYPLNQQQRAEGAASSLVYGILGLFICGPIFGIAALSQANKAKKLIAENPEQYTGEGLATAGLVMGIIDLALWALFILSQLAATG